MTKHHALCLSLMIGSAGCTDTVDSVAREYRNTTNEALDAMMMTTSEESAKAAFLRVLKPLNPRYDEIDKRLDTVKMNREKKDLVAEVFNSDSANTYLSELEVNRQRFALEMARLRKLHKQYQEQGEKCPMLDAFMTPSTFKGLRSQLEKPKLYYFLVDFPSWKINNYEAMYKKFVERRKTFAAREFKLVE